MILEPKSQNNVVEIKSKYLAKLNFIAQVNNFNRSKNNLCIIINYSNGQKEIFKVIEDDYKDVDNNKKSIIQTDLFLNKINWSTESMVRIDLVVFNRN